jgi:predicted ester cyclase
VVNNGYENFIQVHIIAIEENMTKDEMREFFRRYADALNARDFDFIASLIHDEIISAGESYTRDRVIEGLREHINAVPNLFWHLEEVIVEGDRIAARSRNTGTPEREWFGLIPSGASVDYAEFCFYKLRDGRFAEMSYLMDITTIARQLDPR